VVSKLIRKKVRDFKREKEEKIIEEILEKTRSTKRIRKELAKGKGYITYLTDEVGNKIYERNEINILATNFYRELYKNRLKKKEPLIPQNLDSVEPFMYEEIELAIKETKREKAPGHDDILNEQIKYGGEELT